MVRFLSFALVLLWDRVRGVPALDAWEDRAELRRLWREAWR